MESTFDSCFQLAVTQNQINNDLYRLYNVKKGLRNEDGTGVTHRFIEYALPLIQGEPDLPKQDSLPRFAKLKKVLAK